MSLVEGFKIPLLQEPKQMFSPKPQQWNKDQKELIDLEVRISQSNISSREKGWGQQASNQSKKPQQICALTAFQNG